MSEQKRKTGTLLFLIFDSFSLQFCYFLILKHKPKLKQKETKNNKYKLRKKNFERERKIEKATNTSELIEILFYFNLV